ncbi:putative the coatomer is a cytosolic protein complex that binds to dilysine motifs and reversibly associates with Golgi non- clathrin-coated vesicles, which further mediate biosynthetic protein transport from the ER, via the Golgi up to the trans Golgi network [Lyophyllum shimeji]|uniref:Coatomer subunit delta n=1 Tax=Lyophyllum shimeji TaxID=47721 RepID=A0A9P3PXC8_LYOSH|nr:putative the coatomer is a cytosolic protein complex that binds to dilysine motifs and reversibly associates with Golgi non- clathrin-coated vesicles, which further mediate biosynthetic protein transport from the ER, via the Golgi up to the trans Golgi network [Lyophyllum shimeji]
MVVLAASICTKGGKPVISRQFRDMTRTRIESLLASFPKLIPTNTQHTSVETADVRYVYQPLEDLYILLITNKASNILQDIDTLHLFARVVSDLCRSADEREILKNAFELLGAFDEVVSMGYRENVNLVQVRSVLEMESHEEKIQEIIARNKEAEAKEELKRRAKQLEMQRREQQRRAAGAGAGGVGGGYLGGGISGYSPVPQRFDAPEPVTRITPSPVATTRSPAFKGSGMKLGTKKTKQAELLDALGGDVLASSAGASEVSAPPTPTTQAQPAAVQKNEGRGSVPEVEAESVHITIKEQVSLSLLRDGGVQSMELKGDMNLHIADSALAHLRVALSDPATDFGNALQFKQHPNVAKFVPGQERVVALKDPARPFPVGQSLAVLKWRYVGTDESNVPLSINCWPTPSNDGTCEVSIEYELENENVTLYDVVISIPLPTGSYPTVSSHTGDWSLDPGAHALAWSIPLISPASPSSTGSLVFTVAGDDAAAFFPVRVAFVGQGSLAGVGVRAVRKIGGAEEGEEVRYSVDALVASEEYLVV